MKIHEEVQSVKVVGGGEASAFKISNNVVAFKILSDRLYTNKIRAIIRELSCNACDAHVSVDKADIPFDIKLPDFFEKVFSIRDYGTGIDPAEIADVYCNYFNSTKRDSDEVVGQLGLGSKSPFAYTDQFSVSSFFNGTVYHYLAYLNEEGFPTIKELSSETTQEPNGLFVSLIVKESDWTRFPKEAKNILRVFPTKPNGIVLDDFGYKSRFEKNGLEIYTGIDREFLGLAESSKNNTGILMGNIVYPISIEGLHNFLVKVPIGFVNFQPSREHLSLDKYTEANIQKIKDTINEIYTEESDKYDKDSYEGILAHNLAFSSFGRYDSIKIPTSTPTDLYIVTRGKRVEQSRDNKLGFSIKQSKTIYDFQEGFYRHIDGVSDLHYCENGLEKYPRGFIILWDKGGISDKLWDSIPLVTSLEKRPLKRTKYLVNNEIIDVFYPPQGIITQERLDKFKLPCAWMPRNEWMGKYGDSLRRYVYLKHDLILLPKVRQLKFFTNDSVKHEEMVNAFKRGEKIRDIINSYSKIGDFNSILDKFDILNGKEKYFVKALKKAYGKIWPHFNSRYAADYYSSRVKITEKTKKLVEQNTLLKIFDESRTFKNNFEDVIKKLQTL